MKPKGMTANEALHAAIDGHRVQGCSYDTDVYAEWDGQQMLQVWPCGLRLPVWLDHGQEPFRIYEEKEARNGS